MLLFVLFVLVVIAVVAGIALYVRSTTHGKQVGSNINKETALKILQQDTFFPEWVLYEDGYSISHAFATTPKEIVLIDQAIAHARSMSSPPVKILIINDAVDIKLVNLDEMSRKKDSHIHVFTPKFEDGEMKGFDVRVAKDTQSRR